jgi:hypothetical protein
MTNNVGRDVELRLRGVRKRAAGPAVRAAATAGGRAGETMTKMVLQLRTHEQGTRTPAPPGSPPAKILGGLARSIQRTPTFLAGPGLAKTAWGSKLDYAAVQENGAEITAKNFPQLGNPEVGFFGKKVKIPARPFMRPSMDKLISSGKLTDVTSAAFLRSLRLY